MGSQKIGQDWETKAIFSRLQQSFPFCQLWAGHVRLHLLLKPKVPPLPFGPCTCSPLTGHVPSQVWHLSFQRWAFYAQVHLYLSSPWQVPSTYPSLIHFLCGSPSPISLPSRLNWLTAHLHLMRSSSHHLKPESLQQNQPWSFLTHQHF